jgi:hypothetical protein
VREAAPLGGLGQDVLAALVVLVQGVVEAREHPGAVLECRMRGDVLHALAVDPHLAAVVEALEELFAGVRERPALRRGVRRLVAPFRRLGLGGSGHGYTPLEDSTPNRPH